MMRYKLEAEKIMEKFHGFTDGVRFLMLCHRKKEGGENRDRKQLKRITKNKEQFEEVLIEFLEIMDKADIPYRIYSCVNERNIEKGIREFKRQQLEADYYDEENRLHFYHDIKNRWISSLMRPQSKMENSFLIDIDTKNIKTLRYVEKEIASITRNTFKYQTKNGYHIITPPFNPQLLQSEFVGIKKDGLLLLKY